MRVPPQLRSSAVAAAIALLPGLALGAIPERPANEGLLLDEAGLLLPRDRELLEGLQRSTLAADGVAIAVVTVPAIDVHLQRASIERLAQAWMRAWDLGLEPGDRAMLLLIAERDRKARIQLAPGWGRAWDGHARDIMRSEIVPAFRDGAPSRGILAGVVALSEMASLDPAAPPTAVVAPVASAPRAGLASEDVALGVFGAVVLSVLGVAAWLTYRERGGGRSTTTVDGGGGWPDHGGVPGFGSGLDWSGGGFDGGGFSGGGGFDGGGATGSW